MISHTVNQLLRKNKESNRDKIESEREQYEGDVFNNADADRGELKAKVQSLQARLKRMEKH